MHLNPKRALVPAIALGLALLSPAGWAAETIDVRLGYSELVQTGEPAETIIVGNDQVANATIAAESTIVVTGNALGSTNLILLDETGAEISSSVVRVLPVDPRPRQSVRLISGGAEESATVYLCGPEPGCAPTGEDGANVANAAAQTEEGANAAAQPQDDANLANAPAQPQDGEGEGEPEATP